MPLPSHRHGVVVASIQSAYHFFIFFFAFTSAAIAARNTLFDTKGDQHPLSIPFVIHFPLFLLSSF